MREGEVQGEDYLFISSEDFNELLESDSLAEYTEYGGNHYGLTMEELEDKLSLSHAFFICDNNGFNQIREKYDNIVSIFLYADPEDCGDNMQGRGDDLDRINGRLFTYFEEVANKGDYDYVIKNLRGYKNATISVVKSIVNSEILKNLDKGKVM
jgi:guanylate kinase